MYWLTCASFGHVRRSVTGQKNNRQPLFIIYSSRRRRLGMKDGIRTNNSDG